MFFGCSFSISANDTERRLLPDEEDVDDVDDVVADDVVDVEDDDILLFGLPPFGLPIEDLEEDLLRRIGLGKTTTVMVLNVSKFS